MTTPPPAVLARLEALIVELDAYADDLLDDGDDAPSFYQIATGLHDLAATLRACLAQQGEAVDREVRQWRRFYFRHNPASTLLAQIFNDILRANGTYESDWESNARREDAALQPAASEGGNNV